MSLTRQESQARDRVSTQQQAPTVGQAIGNAFGAVFSAVGAVATSAVDAAHSLVHLKDDDRIPTAKPFNMRQSQR